MYNKIFTKILDSSIWLEPDATRIVWVTCLAAMDEDGFCAFAAPANLAHRANVTLTSCLAALETLEGPDPQSSNPDHEGRRLERVPGGWMVLNAQFYADIITREMAKAGTRRRVARHRASKKAGNGVVTVANDLVTLSDTDTDTVLEKEISSEAAAPLSEPPVLLFACVGTPKSWGLSSAVVSEWSDLFPATDVLAECRKAAAWLRASPDRRKTARGMPRFLVAWLTRSVDTRPAPVSRLVRTSPSTIPAATSLDDECPHTPKCDVPGRWACIRKSQMDAFKAEQAR